jgi:hypothetical protein
MSVPRVELVAAAQGHRDRPAVCDAAVSDEVGDEQFGILQRVADGFCERRRGVVGEAVPVPVGKEDHVADAERDGLADGRDEPA